MPGTLAIGCQKTLARNRNGLLTMVKIGNAIAHDAKLCIQTRRTRFGLVSLIKLKARSDTGDQVKGKLSGIFGFDILRSDLFLHFTGRCRDADGFIDCEQTVFEHPVQQAFDEQQRSLPVRVRIGTGSRANTVWIVVT